MEKKVIVFVFLCFQFYGFAQEDAWVYLKDKENVAASIANPISILTQKSIDRKNAHSVAIDERDVPVNENYISQLKTQTGITVLAKSKWFNAVHVRGTQTNINALSGLSFVDQISFADTSLNFTESPQERRQQRPAINKFEFEANSTIFNYGNALNQIEMFKGDDLHQHANSYTGTGMTIAVIDAGFPNVNTMGAFQRLRDAGNLLGGYDFFDRTSDVYANTSSSHGTQVLSNMAGFVQDQYVGTAPDASYYLFRTENAPNENPVEESLWVEAAERADSLGVDIINSSLGYKDYDNTNYSYSASDLNGNTAYITKGANIASEKGILVINAAGNSGSSGLGAPADGAGVFTIGAVDASGNYASFSSQGSTNQPTQKPDVVVQGEASYVINENNTITTSNGTSFSSPTIAGGVACLWQALPNLNHTQIMQLVRESASQYSTPDYLLGYGIPNLVTALAAGETLSIGDVNNINNSVKVYPNPTKNELNIILSSDYKDANLEVYDVLGKKILESPIHDKYKLNLLELAKGMYLIKIKSKGFSKTVKLIKN